MSIFEQSRYFFNYVLPDIIISKLSDLNLFLSHYWWLFLITTFIMIMLFLRSYRKRLKIELLFRKFDNYLDKLGTKNNIQETEKYLLQSKELVKAKYSALYELRGSTYILKATDASHIKNVAVPLRIGKQDIDTMKKSGSFSLNLFISSSKRSAILYYSINEFSLENFKGHLNIALSYLERMLENIQIKSVDALQKISKDTSLSLMKLQMDKFQFFKFFIALIIKITKGQGAKLLTKDGKEVFSYGDTTGKIQKEFYIRNTPYKLEFYDKKMLDPDTIAKIGSFLDMGGSFLVNIDKNSVMVENYLELLKFTNEAIELESVYYQNHSLIVQTVSVEVAKSLFLSEAEIDNIALGAYLHDIGMVGDLLNVLDKKELDSKELDLIKEHPIIGSVMVEPIGHIYPISEIIKYHHERYDGNGYPFGLKGVEIPLPAHIVALGEYYAGITSDRPYRKGKSHEEAIGEIEHSRYKNFDPVVVDAFLDVEKQIHVKIDKIKSKAQNIK